MKCKLKDGEINYETRGEGRPLLVLHGGYLDHRHMIDVMEPVFGSNHKWQRIYPDMPGHGQTTIADTIDNHDQVLDVVQRFMDRVYPDQNYAVAGESRGAYIARGLAAKNPDCVDGLLLVVPGRHATADPKRLPAHVTLERADELRLQLRECEVDRFDKLVVQNREILEKIRKYKIPAVSLADQDCQDRLNANYEFSFDLDAPENIFNRPTLFLLGRFDSAVGYVDALEVMENYPRATYAILDKAGHSLSWEQPELFVVLVRDWLKRIEVHGR